MKVRELVVKLLEFDMDMDVACELAKDECFCMYCIGDIKLDLDDCTDVNRNTVIVELT